MAMNKCPGMSAAFFKPTDVKTRKCNHCGAELEFWKDDIKLECPECKLVNFNPDIGKTCLVYCKKAAECLGTDDIHEWMEREKQRNNPGCEE